jgi:hypothetical protein
MITATIAMAAMAVLFVLFGLTHRGQERRGCGGGDCTSCSNPNECEIGTSGIAAQERLP